MSRDHKLLNLVNSCALAAGVIFAFNKIHGFYATRNHVLGAQPENFFNWKGVRVYFEKKGSGAPIVLLHALHPAASAYEWHRIIDLLATDHTVYALDLPGCGRSDKPRTLFTNFYYVQLVRDFIRTMSLEGTTLVASNLTTSVAVMTTAYEPELVRSLILISPPSAEFLSEVPVTISKIEYFFLGLPLIGRLIYSILASRPQIDMYFAEHYLYNPFHDNDELVDVYFESAHLGDGRGHYFAASQAGKYLNMNIGYALSKLDLPIKIIIGDATEGAEEILREWIDIKPGVSVARIEHTKQLPMLEEPERTAEEITNFL